MDVYLLNTATGCELYVDRGRGSVLRLGEWSDVAEVAWQIPTQAEELLTPAEDVGERCWELIKDIPVSKKARAAIRAALGVED